MALRIPKLNMHVKHVMYEGGGKSHFSHWAQNTAFLIVLQSVILSSDKTGKILSDGKMSVSVVQQNLNPPQKPKKTNTH